MPVDSHEMHPTRWGDPAAAAPLPDSARGLIELAFGLDERPAVEHPSVPAGKIDHHLLDGLRDLLGADHVRTDDESRRLRTRGKSTPDLLRARAGELDDAPERHDGQVVLDREGKYGGHVVVVAGADHRVGGVVQLAGPGPEQVGGGLAAGAEPP